MSAVGAVAPPMFLVNASVVPRIPPDWTKRVSVPLTKVSVVVAPEPMTMELATLLPAIAVMLPFTRMLLPAPKRVLPYAGSLTPEARVMPAVVL